MANYLRPRRGKKTTAESQLTSANPLKRGEIFFEVPTAGVGTGAGNIKMGDGATAYASLPYFINGSLIGNTSIASIGDGTITGAISQLNNDLANLDGDSPLSRLEEITFPSDGSILETMPDNSTLQTVFNSDGSISEIYTVGSTVTTHKTIFNSNGSISVVEVVQGGE